jgi:hypothetical protein
MATRMQQRRGTAAQWTSSNAGDGPILNAGEIGWESDTNKFKIGDGVSYWSALTYFVDATDVIASSLGAYLQDSDVGAISGVAGLDASKNLVVPGASIIVEGATANDYETTLTVTDPTADRTITFPNADGTVITTGNLSDITNIGVFTSTITMEGSTANDFELTLSAGDPTADRTLTFPDATDTLVGRATTDTLTNKSISLGSNTVTSTLAQLNTAVSDADVASLAGSETLTNKTINIASNTLTGVAPLASPTFTGTVTLPANTIQNVHMGDDSVGTNEISGGAVTTEKLADSAITSAKIANDTIVDADINSAAAIATSKISGLDTALGLKAPLAAPALTGDATAVNLTISGNLTVNGTTTNLNSTNLVIEDKNIILGDTATPTDTTADGGGITLKGTTDKTLNWVDATDAWTSSEDLNLLTGKVYEINGTTVLSSTTLGSGVTGSSLTSVGTLSSGTWSATTIATTKGGTGLTGYTAGDLVYASATDTLAKLAAGTNGKLLTMVSGAPAWEDAPVSLPSQTGNSGKYLTTDGSTASWGTVSGFSAPTLGSTSIASGATVTTIVGLTKVRSDVFTTLDASGYEIDIETMQIMGAF